MNKKETLIKELGLSQHIEGGYFRQLYRSNQCHRDRNLMTVIHYMVTNDYPVTQWHMNKSDICHFHHQGGRLRYFIIDPKARTLETHVLSSNFGEKQSSYFLARGGTWKVCCLQDGEYSLISESVAPGFDYKDEKIISPSQLASQFSQFAEQINQLDRKKVKKMKEQK